MLLVLILFLGMGAFDLSLNKAIQHSDKEAAAYEDELAEVNEASKSLAELHKSEVLKATRTLPKEITAPKPCDHNTSSEIGRCSVANMQDSTSNSRKSENLESENSSSTASGPELIVFISSTLPKNALKQLALESKKAPVRFIIKGLVNGSFHETAALVKEIGVAIDIDPILFEKLNISQVPVFAHKVGEDWHCLRGNVTLGFALEKLKVGA